MESEVFYLMELQGATYDSVMGMPHSRRKRFVEQKDQLERERRAQAEQDASRSAARARSRRRR